VSEDYIKSDILIGEGDCSDAYGGSIEDLHGINFIKDLLLIEVRDVSLSQDEADQKDD
jgi:hypothetical protein